MPEDDIIDLPDDDIIDVPEAAATPTPAPKKKRAKPDAYYGEVKPKISAWESFSAGVVSSLPGATKAAARVHSWLDPNTSYEDSKQIMQSGRQQAADANPALAAVGNVAGNVALGAIMPGGFVAKGAGAVKQLAGTAALAAAQSAGEQEWTVENSVDALQNVGTDVLQSTAMHGGFMAAGKGVKALTKAGAERASRTAKNVVNKETAEQMREYGFKQKDLIKAESKASNAAVLRNKAAQTNNVKEAAEALVKVDNMEQSIPVSWIKKNIKSNSWRDMEQQAITIKQDANDAIGDLLRATDQEYAKIAQGGKVVRPEMYKRLADDLMSRSETHAERKLLKPVVDNLMGEHKVSAELGGHTLDNAYKARSKWATQLEQLNRNPAGDQTRKMELRATVDALDDIIEGHITRVAPDKKGRLDALRLNYSQATAAESAFARKVVEKLPRWSATVDSVKDSLIMGGAKSVQNVERRLRLGQHNVFGKYGPELERAMRKGTLAQAVYLLTRQDPEFAEQVRKGTTKETE